MHHFPDNSLPRYYILPPPPYTHTGFEEIEDVAEVVELSSKAQRRIVHSSKITEAAEGKAAWAEWSNKKWPVKVIGLNACANQERGSCDQSAWRESHALRCRPEQAVQALTYSIYDHIMIGAGKFETGIKIKTCYKAVWWLNKCYFAVNKQRQLLYILVCGLFLIVYFLHDM